MLGAMLESLSVYKYGASRIFTLSHGQRNGQDHFTTEIHTSSFMLVSFVPTTSIAIYQRYYLFESIDLQENTRCKVVLIRSPLLARTKYESR